MLGEKYDAVGSKKATEKGLARLIIVSTSGGARMYEGMFSYQMARRAEHWGYNSRAAVTRSSVC